MDWLALSATLLACVGAAGLLMSVVFLWATAKKRIDVIDVFWAPAILLAVLVAAAMNLFTIGVAGAVSLLLVMVWAFRLTLHLSVRFQASNSQDKRYTELIKKWPQQLRDIQVYLRIYIVQAMLAVVIGLAAIITIMSQTFSTQWLVVGVLVWTIGIAIEAAADWQLKSFIASKSHKDRLLQTGLWRYSRHPNYFGEAMSWWGIWLITLGTPYWWLALLAPVAITVLLLFVSGVPQTEKQMARKPGWREYKAATSWFVPWPPKR